LNRFSNTWWVIDLSSDRTSVIALGTHLIRKIIFSKKIIMPILITTFLVFVMYYGSTDDGSLATGIDMLDALILSFFNILISMVYSTSLIKNDVEDRSIINVLTAPLHKGVIFLTYYFSLIVAVSFIMLFTTMFAYMGYFYPAGLTWTRTDYLVSILWLVLISVVVYCAFFITISVMLKRPIYFGLFYLFIWEGFVIMLPGRIGHFTVNHFIRSIGSDLIEHGEISNYVGTSFGMSIIVLIVVWISLLAIGTYLFTNKEFT